MVPINISRHFSDLLICAGFIKKEKTMSASNKRVLANCRGFRPLRVLPIRPKENAHIIVVIIRYDIAILVIKAI